MIVLTYTKPNDLNRLHEELIAALPTVPLSDLIVEGLGDIIHITVPATVSTATVDSVVAAHIATPITFKTRLTYVDEFVDTFPVPSAPVRTLLKERLKRALGLLPSERLT